MIFKLITLQIILSCFLLIYAQEDEIYVPPKIQNIYNNGLTRTWDGKPGKDYWQNSSDYFLRVELDTETNLIKGEANIIYHNNSPDTLTKIVFRFYQDFFKKGMARDFGVYEKALTDGTIIDYLSVNGNEVDPDTAGTRPYTNYNLSLIEPLLPSSSINFEIGWHFTLPHIETMRMGKYREGGIFVAYWYPQISVYDDVDGWDITDYLGKVEFYNDVNNFEVEITVPENYLVRATGELMNAKSILQEDIYTRYTDAILSDKVIKIITPEDLEQESITNDGDQTWYYKATGVPDFTFACVKDYLWDGVAVVADKETGRKALADVIYKEGDIHFDEGASFSKTIVEYLSNDLPGVSFPYSHITSFCNGDGGGGMESPMMTNDGAPAMRSRTFSLLLHEIAHTYFPFYMGLNERKYAWMDEGMATFLTKDLVLAIDSNYNHYDFIFRRYSPVLGEESDVPLMIPSKLVKGYPLTAVIYGKAFFALVALQDLLGEELFKKALKEFIYRWNGKHPLPYDFFFTFNDVSGQDLSWFWNPWFYDMGYCDLGIEQNAKGEFVVKLIGNHPVSVDVTISYEDGSEKFIKETPAIWKGGNKEFVLEIDNSRRVASIELDDKRIPDLNPDNNYLDIE